MSGNYTAYHVHTELSLLDSATKFEDYIAKAVELGQTAIAFTEHGNIYQWVAKKMACDKAGLKYLHGCEIYLTEDLLLPPDPKGVQKQVMEELALREKSKELTLAAQESLSQRLYEAMIAANYQEEPDPGSFIDEVEPAELEPDNFAEQRFAELMEAGKRKVRDNYHTILIAKNYAGLQEMNELISRSSQDDHFYYKPRITFDEFLGISSNVIKISACLASPLNRMSITHPMYERLLKHYDYLEIQAHDHPEQVAYNRHLAEMSQKYGIPLIAGTDTHSLNKYKAECRTILQLSKHIEFADEDTFDLIMVFYKSPPPYHPQMTVGEKNHTKGKAVGKQAEDVHSNRSYGNYTLVESPDGNMKYPASIWRFPKPHPSVALHATEKPVDLLRYAIRTYTDRNAIVLDNCCGTGSTLIAAKLEGRRYIGIDNGVCDKKKSPYYGMPWAQVAQIRLEAIDHEPADEPERHRPLGEGTTEGVCTPSGVSA